MPLKFKDALIAAVPALVFALAAPPAYPQQQAAAPSLTGATANFAPNDPPGEWHSQARD